MDDKLITKIVKFMSLENLYVYTVVGMAIMKACSHDHVWYGTSGKQEMI